MFVVRRVDRESRESAEQLGSKRKFWFSENGKRWLFKAEDRDTGEDWAEVIACHLCKLLGLPHVHYDLAAEHLAGEYVRPGVVCENLAPSPLSLVLGNQLLFKLDQDYPSRERFRVRQHTVAAVSEVGKCVV